MRLGAGIVKLLQQERLNVLLTNLPPRRLATRAVGWLSRIEHPLVCALSLRVWGWFSTLDLGEARETQFRSMHHCFTRRLKPGARPVAADPSALVSPCDGIVGAAGLVRQGQVLQVKGQPYALAELLADPVLADALEGGCYVTLRLTAAMYHRFHAPEDCRVDAVTHVFGDTWNVNPATLKRVRRVFCRNERAVIQVALPGTDRPLVLVAVAAILVAGIRLHFLDMPVGAARRLTKRYDCAASLRRGDEMGWFEHGSTIVVVAPAGFTPREGLREGDVVRMGQVLLRRPASAAAGRR